ncbi:MAG TPA: DUF4340 domain-containing protein [Opitutaceae bacterium]|nr:DUF4340 domain-containing protein [Opitutaceae bacterium]
MKLKTLIITVVILGAAAAVVEYTTRPSAPRTADPRVGQPLVSADTIEKAARFKFADQGKSVEVVKSADGAWHVPSYYDFPADFSKLSNLVNELSGAKIEQFVTSNPERLARLDFKGTKVELLDAAEKSLVQLNLGKVADAGGRFVRFGDEPRAYRSGFNPYLDVEPKSWADSTLLSIKSDDIAKLEIDFADGAPVTVSRAKKEDSFTTSDAPAGQKLKGDKVASIISSIANLRFSDTSDLTDAAVTAAKEHHRSAKITTFDGKTYTVALGRKPEQKIIKPPAPKPDGQSGPASLGKVADLAKPATPAASAEASKEAEKSSATDAKKDATKIAQPETDTIPAGPVYAFVKSSDAKSPVNAMAAKRAFQVYEYAFTSLPEKRDELFEPAPTPTPQASPTAKPAEATPASPAAPAKEVPKP